jgi:hypothetical protein
LFRELSHLDKEIEHIAAITIQVYNSKTRAIEDRVRTLNPIIEDFEPISSLYEDDSYEQQEVFALILFSDNTWLSRGSNFTEVRWQYHKQPSISDVINMDYAPKPEEEEEHWACRT